MELVGKSIAGLPAFALYLTVSLGMLALFLVIYVRITPYREFALIRAGNCAAAASLSGAMIGFVLPLSHAIAQSHNLPDMMLWGLIGLVVQLLAYFAASRILPGIAQDIPAGKVSQGVFLGALSIATGLLNAACMTY